MFGLPEGSRAAQDVTAALIARAAEAGYQLDHLGANPGALHRCFALHADVFFDGGVDAAIRSFRPSHEVVQAILVPLCGLTGARGEVEVDDVRAQRHRLRGSRHLGAQRIDWIRRRIARIAAAPSGEASTSALVKPERGGV